MTNSRQDLIARIEEARTTKVLVYVTGDRPNLETKVHPETLDYFTHHLDATGDVPKISLFLYTRGGDTLAAWSIANLIRQFCSHLEIIVPSKAHSAGTLMCLAADSIVMTKQATLGPIDPSVSTPLNPGIPGAPPHVKIPVSVEDIGGYIDFARSVSDTPQSLLQALTTLANAVHPLVLGNAFRARTQIRMLAKKLMANRSDNDQRTENILQFLCSESGSHDYTINRREARDQLGLPIEKPGDELYAVIKALYDDLAAELELTVPYDPNSFLAGAPARDYSFHRAVIQSMSGGKHTYLSEGSLTRHQVPTPQGPQPGIQDQRTFEGWRRSDV